MKRLVALGLAATLAGCSLFTSKDTGPKMAGVPPLANAVPVKAMWSANVGRSAESILSPATAPGAVFAASREGNVTKLDATNGRVLWRAQVGQPISGGVGASADLVAVGTAEGEVIALDANDG